MNNTEQRFILSLDQGTTSSRAIIFNHSGQIKGSAQQEFTQYYPEPGWVEHDPEEIWSTQLCVARQAILNAGIGPESIESIGITNQRETVVVWDKDSGRPVYNAIVWQCRRSSAICDELRDSGLEEEFRQRTGLRLDSYFSATKLSWLFREIPGLKALAENGEILFGTVDTWLLWKLTGQHVTDITNASRTLLFNIREEKWDPVLLSVLGIPEQILPSVKSSSDNFGSTKTDIFGVSIPVTGVAGDQQAALFGHTCFSPGMAKNTYGTGCFTLLNTGDKPVWSKNNLLTTIAWKINNHTTFALEGSVFVAGAIIQWLRDELKIITSSAESEELARSVPSSEGVYIVPAFTGLGAPYWDSDTRASILGLSRGSNKAHIARAALESICYQSEDLLASMQADCNEPIAVLKADGGATANSLLMQLQADISNIPVLLPGITEITALGAAYLSGLYTGFWENLSDIEKNWQMKCRFVPSIRDKERKQKLDRWHKAVSVTREF